VIVSVWNVVLQGWNVVVDAWKAMIFPASVAFDKRR